MTKQFVYTHVFDADSEVIETVYYSQKTRDLFVALNSGSIAGYKNVPLWVYDQFAGSSSKGRFWNRDIKNRFATQSGDVVFVPYEKSEEFPTAEEVSEMAERTIAPGSFKIVFEVSGTLTVTGTAKSGEDAIRLAKAGLDEVFEGKVKLKELIQTFE